jgi:hypothetical protein
VATLPAHLRERVFEVGRLVHRDHVVDPLRRDRLVGLP